jgi:hypothetical protein
VLPSPINNSSHLKNELASREHMEFRMVRQHVDRIQVSIKSKDKAYARMRDALNNRFEKAGVRSLKKRYVRKFKFGHVRFSLIYHRDYPFWFTLSIFNATDDIQVLLKEIMHLLNIAKYASVSQVEFALDLYPEIPWDLYDIELFAKGLVLTHSRSDSFKRIGRTMYQGRRGTVRRGSKGIRCYPKVAKGFYRVELQANKGLLRKEGITFESLPIRPSHISVFDHVQLRHGLDAASLPKLADLLAKRRLSRANYGERKMRIAGATLSNAFESLIACAITEDGTRLYGDLNARSVKPVAKQINYFKKIKEQSCITNQIDEYFPKRSIVDLFKGKFKAELSRKRIKLD